MTTSDQKNILIISILYIATPLVLAGFLSLFAIRRIPDSSQSKQDALTPIYNEHPVSQSITPQNNGLNTAVIYLRNASLKNTDPLYFTLSNSQNESVRQIAISGANVGDGDMIRFQFTPLPDSANQTYILTLSAPYTNFDAVKIEAGTSKDGKLTHELYYQPQSRSQLVTNIISQLTPKLTSSRLLILFGLTFLISYLSLRHLLHRSFP